MWQKQFNAKPAPDTPLYIIGDIHGRCDLLIRLIAMIDADALERRLSNHKIVFVGDYVDRGPQSSLVLSLVQELMADENRDVVVLKGNHEHMLLAFLEDPSKGARWLKNGGYETLVSYGIANVTETSDEQKLECASNQFRETLGAETIAFLEGLDLSFKSGNMFVCHAGADPTLPLDKQDEQALVWGPENYNKKKRKDKNWVAHGHYVESAPVIDNGRICVDTGAYFSNQLTAARILSDEVKFMTAEL